MSDVNTGLTANACTEFINSVEQASKDALKGKPEVAGLLSVGLSLAAEGAVAVGDSAGSTTAGP